MRANISCDRTETLREKIAAERSDHHAEPLNQSSSCGPARQRADRDPAQMQQAGGDDKADAVGQWIGGARKLGPMRVSMKNRKHGDDDRGGREWQTQAEGQPHLEPGPTARSRLPAS